MLTFMGVNTRGERLSLPSPVEAVLCRDAGTPADSLTAVFPCVIYDELCYIAVYKDGKEIFSGIVDEQITVSGENVKTKLVCRSMAALLVDNEAQPCTFRDVSASLIFSRYVKPLGFASFTGEDKTLRGEFRVAKGESCWQVLEDFCSKAYGVFPVVEGNRVYMQGTEGNKECLVFSDKGDGIAYSNLEHNLLRCKLISCVRCKVTQGEDYTSYICNEDAQARGVLRERYLNADELSGKSLADADKLIVSARAKAEKFTLLVPQCMTDIPGAQAVVCDSAVGEHRGLYVTGIRYSLNSTGETTRLTLMRKEN
ncbi:MAG: hypothetical protein IJ298_06295 [Ruminococcus sp.]|nr:hypothetical protein [Ruminococcus sp.]